MNKERLVVLLTDLVRSKELLPKRLPDGTLETYCNFALLRVAVAHGCKDFASVPNANAIYNLVKCAADWQPASGKEAHAWAGKGLFAIAAKQFAEHGHVAAVFPRDMMHFSASLQKDVPWLANVGKTNGIMPQSQCFPVKESEPEYFLWTGSSGY